MLSLWPSMQTPLPRRRLSDRELCSGAVRTSHYGALLSDVSVDFSLFDTRAAPSLWASRPLLGAPRRGVMRAPCSANDLQTLLADYEGLHLQPLVAAIRPKRPLGQRSAEDESIAVFLLADYANLFHQMGSLYITAAAMRDLLGSKPDTAHSVHVFLLNNASLTPTAVFWSPGLSARAPRFVGEPAARSAGVRSFGRVLLVQPATETWWWNVWKPDPTDRSALLGPIASWLSSAVLGAPPPSRPPPQLPPAVAEPGARRRLLLLLSRAASSDRRILNEEELRTSLEGRLRHGGTPPVGSATEVRLVELGALSSREQLSLVRGAAGLIGAHGAALVWNLFLPTGAPVLELLNRANANAYYSNQCRWQRRGYAAWQNNDSAREEQAFDADGRVLDPFRWHLRADVGAVGALLEGLLSSPRHRAAEAARAVARPGMVEARGGAPATGKTKEVI